jgi:hypothetical protein
MMGGGSSSVQWLVCVLGRWGIGIQFAEVSAIVLFFTTSRLALPPPSPASSSHPTIAYWDPLYGEYEGKADKSLAL